MKFVEIMQEKDQAILTIIRNITAILQRSIVTDEFLEYFADYLINKKISVLKNSGNISNSNNNYNHYNNSNYYEWIEKLLQTPIEDYRKFILWRILCPYLINIKRLSYGESSYILQQWLDKCNSLRKLDFNPNQRIRDNLKTVGNFTPIRLYKIKTDNNYRKLHQLVNQGKENDNNIK